MKNKKIILIVGPTAVGKTALSIYLSKKLKTEIISCDSRQFYRELKIGTAPPSKEELSQVKHHFIHNKSVSENYNAGEFEKDAIKKINELHKTKDIVIAVGGSGLYIDAICKGFDKMPNISDEIRAHINKEFKQNGIEWLQKEVHKIDPIFLKNADKENPHRLLRALEIYKSSGKKLSSLKSNNPKIRPFQIIKIGLNIERDLLYNKINTRVDKMIKEGLLDEVKSLLHFKERNALQTVGYKELFHHYKDKFSAKEAISKIKQNTRRFAKRQITWFKKDQSIKWFEPNQINEINDFISKL